MSLRTKLALWVGVLVASAIAVSGWIVVRGAESELVDEVDAFLEDRVERLSAEPLRRGSPFSRSREARNEVIKIGRQFTEALTEDDAATQLVAPDGEIILASSVELPVGAEDLEVANGLRRRSEIRTVDVDGTRYRVISGYLEPLGAIMVGRDLSEVDGALDGITRRTFIMGVVGAMAAALLAWVLAGRLSRPINQVTSAAEHVAETQDLSASIEVSGGGEAARLASSFNTMLEALDTSRLQQHRLVMDASHELRTPLTSVRTNLDVLRRARSISDADREEVLEDLSAEVDDLTGLVTELVELATSSRRPNEPIEVADLGVVATTVADRSRRRSDRDVVVDVVRDGSVLGYPSLIERAISNLVDNALKYSEGDAPVVIRVDGGRVDVRDDGPGVSEADKQRIFDRFYRSVTTGSTPGSGLGLSIVKDVVTAHGGTVFVDDVGDGPGAVVGFELPLRDAADARPDG